MCRSIFLPHGAGTCRRVRRPPAIDDAMHATAMRRRAATATRSSRCDGAAAFRDAAAAPP
jgi:hypothetical protein